MAGARPAVAAGQTDAARVGSANPAVATKARSVTRDVVLVWRNMVITVPLCELHGRRVGAIP